MKEEHKYWCEDCEYKFYSLEAVCPNCESTKVGIDEPIIRKPKVQTKKLKLSVSATYDIFTNTEINGRDFLAKLFAEKLDDELKEANRKLAKGCDIEVTVEVETIEK